MCACVLVCACVCVCVGGRGEVTTHYSQHAVFTLIQQEKAHRWFPAHYKSIDYTNTL